MCLIIDANLASLIYTASPNPDFAPILRWLEDEDGCLVFGGKLGNELFVMDRARRYIKMLTQAGKAKQFPSNALSKEEDNVRASGLCSSDDPHVIALARILERDTGRWSGNHPVFRWLRRGVNDPSAAAGPPLARRRGGG